MYRAFVAASALASVGLTGAYYHVFIGGVSTHSLACTMADPSMTTQAPPPALPSVQQQLGEKINRKHVPYVVPSREEQLKALKSGKVCVLVLSATLRVTHK